MGPTWGPLGADRTQVGPMWAPWTLLSRVTISAFESYHIIVIESQIGGFPSQKVRKNIYSSNGFVHGGTRRIPETMSTSHRFSPLAHIIPVAESQPLRQCVCAVCDIFSHWNLMMTSSNGNIFRVTGTLCGEFTGPRWIPLTKASYAGFLCFVWSGPE